YTTLFRSRDSVVSRLSAVDAPAVDAAGLVIAILSNMDSAPPADLRRLLPKGSARRTVPPLSRATSPPLSPASRPIGGPTGLGTSAARMFASGSAADHDTAAPELFCPGALRDDPALGEEVDDRLVAWAEQVGIYPERLD